jgi:hypothetical protein
VISVTKDRDISHKADCREKPVTLMALVTQSIYKAHKKITIDIYRYLEQAKDYALRACAFTCKMKTTPPQAATLRVVASGGGGWKRPRRISCFQ